MAAAAAVAAALAVEAERAAAAKRQTATFRMCCRAALRWCADSVTSLDFEATARFTTVPLFYSFENIERAASKIPLLVIFYMKENRLCPSYGGLQAAACAPFQQKMWHLGGKLKQPHGHISQNWTSRIDCLCCLCISCLSPFFVQTLCLSATLICSSYCILTSRAAAPGTSGVQWRQVLLFDAQSQAAAVFIQLSCHEADQRQRRSGRALSPHVGTWRFAVDH